MKNNNNNNSEKKKFGAETWDGLLPNCIARREFCIAIHTVYCKLERLVKAKEGYCSRFGRVGCNTNIVLQAVGWRNYIAIHKNVLQ